jgi:large subunit ribosomal protein L22
MATTQTKTPVKASNAKLSYAMISPYRCRLVANLIRGKTIEDASRLLLLEHKKAAKILYKLLKSAMSNAEQKGVADLERLYVSDLQVNEGPRIKRWMPRSQGRADQRLSRTSHIIMGLAEKTGVAKAKTAATPKAAKKKTTSKKGEE